MRASVIAKFFIRSEDFYENTFLFFRIAKNRNYCNTVCSYVCTVYSHLFLVTFFIVGTLLLSLQKKYCSFIFWVVVGFLFVCDISSQAYRSYFG